MCGSLHRIIHILAPRLIPQGELWNGRNGRSGKLRHSSDVIGECYYLHVNVCGSAHSCGWVWSMAMLLWQLFQYYLRLYLR